MSLDEAVRTITQELGGQRAAIRTARAYLQEKPPRVEAAIELLEAVDEGAVLVDTRRPHDR